MEIFVTDHTGTDRTVADCGQYWLQTGVPRRTVSEMKAELSTHLREAIDAGKSVEAVVGNDLAGFAEAWATEYRAPAAPSAWNTRYDKKQVRRDIWSAYGWLVAVAAAIFVLIVVGPKEETMEDTELWRWIWVGAFVVLGIGEMITAGLFMLPFAFGAGAGRNPCVVRGGGLGAAHRVHGRVGPGALGNAQVRLASGRAESSGWRKTVRRCYWHGDRVGRSGCRYRKGSPRDRNVASDDRHRRRDRDRHRGAGRRHPWRSRGRGAAASGLTNPGHFKKSSSKLVKKGEGKWDQQPSQSSPSSPYLWCM